jgi:ketopantoate hydroxymethyltransferase
MMVVHGDRDTLGATTEIMALYTRAVARGAPEKLIVADLPFLAGRKGCANALEPAEIAATVVLVDSANRATSVTTSPVRAP